MKPMLSSALVATSILVLATAEIAGAAAPRLAGYVKPDGTNAVVYWGDDSNVYELSNGLLAATAGWSWANLTAAAKGHPASSQPFTYVRCDGITAVVYRSLDKIYELHPIGGGWAEELLPMDMPAVQWQFSMPSGFCRSDGASTVVYTGSDSHVHAISRAPRATTWSSDSGIFSAGGSVSTQGNPFGYVRSDGVNSVVFTGNVSSHVFEIFLQRFCTTCAVKGSPGQWSLADLTAVSDLHPLAKGDPFAYRRSDGVNAVDFRGADSHVWDLRLERGGAGWLAADLTALSGASSGGGDPMSYRRSDGVDSVLYFSFNGQSITELYLRPNAPWRQADLTSIAGVPIFSVGGSPMGYANSFGTNTVFYVGSDQHIHRLQDTQKSTYWADDDVFKFIPAWLGIPPLAHRYF